MNRIIFPLLLFFGGSAGAMAGILTNNASLAAICGLLGGLGIGFMLGKT